jgi:hypothetical protein
MYVRRWPRISASSRTPPSESRTNLRPVARAMLLAMLVLPTPGGPTKHKIGPLSCLVSAWTAKYSTMRSLHFLRP